EDAAKIPDVSIVESSAEMLYGLVHQRYILGRAGQQAMVDKYESGIFGSCPRVYCVGCNVVPCGRSDLPGIDTVKLFCPNCNDIYVPPSSRFQGVDGAFFGTTFAHLFFQNYRESAPAPFWKAPASGGTTANRGSPFVNPNPYGGQKRAAGYVYVPRIYGFKVSDRAKCGPRMQWLRLRPETPAQLDQVDWRGRWIDEDEYEDDEDEQDRQMEDFDPDAADEDDDEEEDEDEEDEEGTPGQQQHGQRHADGIPAARSVRTLPTASRADAPVAVISLPPATGGKVKLVRQWAARPPELTGTA
ncbi:casein kinase II, regulatory subunit, partial [Mycena leptocephala]